MSEVPRIRCYAEEFPQHDDLTPQELACLRDKIRASGNPRLIRSFNKSFRSLLIAQIRVQEHHESLRDLSVLMGVRDSYLATIPD
jgi:hypothetical protein